MADGTHCRETERVNFDTKSRDVLLFEFASQVALNEGGLQSQRKALVIALSDRCRERSQPLRLVYIEIL
jgi:hypothetical protein